MKQFPRHLPLLGILACVLLFLAACVERFEVVATNHGSERVVIGIAQYHSEKFDGTPPKLFPIELLLQHHEVYLEPGESRTLLFSSASGGFWLRWRQLSPVPDTSSTLTIDLIRDTRTIDVQ